VLILFLASHFMHCFTPVFAARCYASEQADGSWVSGSNRSLFWMGHMGHGSVDVDL